MERESQKREGKSVVFREILDPFLHRLRGCPFSPGENEQVYVAESSIFVAQILPQKMTDKDEPVLIRLSRKNQPLTSLASIIIYSLPISRREHASRVQKTCADRIETREERKVATLFFSCPPFWAAILMLLLLFLHLGDAASEHKLLGSKKVSFQVL